MLTEKELSASLQKVVKAPIRVGNLADLHIDQEKFLAFFQPFFEELEDDTYLIRQNQLEFLLEQLPQEQLNLQKLHPQYFAGHLSQEALTPYINQLSPNQQAKLEQLSKVTRQRSLAIFELTWQEDQFQITPIEDTKFQQKVEDFREWERVFAPTDPKAIGSTWFTDFLRATAKMVKQIHPECTQLKMTAHFMRTLAYENIAGENAPEGIHEDGTPYIISALVINRKNALGGESSIYEQVNQQQKELLYKKALAAGEFIFQADTGEEHIFGNDLWHHVSAIFPEDVQQVATRDIIGLDIDWS